MQFVRASQTCPITDTLVHSRTSSGHPVHESLGRILLTTCQRLPTRNVPAETSQKSLSDMPNTPHTECSCIQSSYGSPKHMEPGSLESFWDVPGMSCLVWVGTKVGALLVAEFV